ncbi:hypothetical protein GSI_10078 [Ganoderma sinense ZZ0214-1]|uniref:Uncharacterized protein n=1 Tax=Ganoderma sinense ZZ0214-1 TaxID=1077348 RepID=A0A2G8RZI9_9APHY|nr:hypothetical protein GSI_10078 [Ganoderma sinense ZZ0214-1]
MAHSLIPAYLKRLSVLLPPFSAASAYMPSDTPHRYPHQSYDDEHSSRPPDIALSSPDYSTVAPPAPQPAWWNAFEPEQAVSPLTLRIPCNTSLPESTRNIFTGHLSELFQSSGNRESLPWSISDPPAVPDLNDSRAFMPPSHHFPPCAVSEARPPSIPSLPPVLSRHALASRGVASQGFPLPIIAGSITLNGMMRVAPTPSTPRDGPQPVGGALNASLGLAPFGAPSTIYPSNSVSTTLQLPAPDTGAGPAPSMELGLSTSPEATTMADKPGRNTSSCDGQSTTANRQPQRAELVPQSTVSYGSGCRLDLVKQGQNPARLSDFDAVAFQGQTFAQKTTFQLVFEGYTVPFHQQYNVLLDKGRIQPTKRRLAKVICKAVECFIKLHTDFEYGLERIELLSIGVVSRSSIRPVFRLL